MSGKESDESWRGKIGKMSADEVDAFLNEPFLARVACLDDNEWPYVVPCWYQWDGAALWVVPRARSAWALHLEARPRCAVTIDESSAADRDTEKGVQRRFLAQCEAAIVERPNVGGRWVQVARDMSIRYYGENVDDGLNPRLFAFLGARALGRDVADGCLSPVN